MKPKRLFGFSIGALLAVTAVVAVGSYLASPLRWKDELVSELRDADEVDALKAEGVIVTYSDNGLFVVPELARIAMRQAAKYQ